MTYHICYDTDTYLIKREDNSYLWLDDLNEPLNGWNCTSEYATFAEWFEDMLTTSNMRYLGSCTDISSFIADHPEHFI